VEPRGCPKTIHAARLTRSRKNPVLGLTSARRLISAMPVCVVPIVEPAWPVAGRFRLVGFHAARLVRFPLGDPSLIVGPSFASPFPVLCVCHSLSLQVIDCPTQHVDAVAKLAKCVVAVVAQPAPKLIGVVVVVEYDLAAAPFADRTRRVGRFRILPMESCPDFPLVSPAIVASVFPQHAAWQCVVDRKVVEWFRLVTSFADPH